MKLDEVFRIKEGPGLGAEVHLVLRNGKQIDLDKPTWDALVKVAMNGVGGDLPANVRSNLKLFLQKVGGQQ